MCDKVKLSLLQRVQKTKRIGRKELDFRSASAVLQRIGKATEILTIVKKRKLEYFVYVMRNTKKYDLLIIQGKLAGRRRPGHRSISWLTNLRRWFGKSTRSLFRAAVSKVEIALMTFARRRHLKRSSHDKGVTYPLQRGGDGDDLLYGAAEPLDVVGPVQHVADVHVVGQRRVAQPAPQVVPAHGRRALEDGQRHRALRHRRALRLARDYEPAPDTRTHHTQIIY